MQNIIKQLVQQLYGATLDVQIIKKDEKNLSAILSGKIKQTTNLEILL